MDWLHKGMFWNEAFLLRSFLMFNSSFEILMFNDYVSHAFADRVRTVLPDFTQDHPGTSLWIRRNL
jgi:hypothetical protein